MIKRNRIDSILTDRDRIIVVSRLVFLEAGLIVLLCYYASSISSTSTTIVLATIRIAMTVIVISGNAISSRTIAFSIAS